MLNMNEASAMRLVLEFISVKSLLTAAMNGFADSEKTPDRENSDICFKALQAYLK